VFADGVTLGSFLTDFVPQHHLTIVRATLAGTEALGLHGIARDPIGVAAVDTIYVPASGSPLPFEEKTLVRGGGTGNVRMGQWKEVVLMRTPSNAVPLSTAVPKWH
jgi:hypothetical protein